jgi:hypothetical protein
MKRIVIAALAASFSAQAMAEGLPLRRVVLSTAGLAQFTHSGDVAAGSTVDLPVRLDQVDDLLKSLTIFDQENAIGAVSLPGQAPLTELFRDLPFGEEALESLPALLNALIGSEIEIEGPLIARGRLLRVVQEVVNIPDNGHTTRNRLVLMTEGGIVQAILEELSAVRFTDMQTQAQIDRALAGLAQNRAKDRRTLAIGLLGTTTRPVGFSYVVAAPVWKTAYRLVLPQDDSGKARLQGWGVVENLTGGDWKDVELSLISGNPVALKQPLYTAFFAERPEIPITAAQRIVPRKDDADEPAPAPPAPMASAPGAGKARGMMQERSAKPTLGFAGGAADQMAAEAEVPTQIGSAAFAAEAEEAATQISYRFPEKLSLTAGSTVMVPFVDREISASRSWLYQPETNTRHPLASVRLQNDGETALPAGIITAFDRTGDGKTNFVGDAQLPLTGKGASKFVTFALDSKTDVRRIDHGVKQTRLGKAVDGQLTLTVKSQHSFDYEITPPAEEDRQIVIDEARADGWTPANPAGEVEQTAARLRYKVNAPKGQTTKASLVLERTDYQSIRLTTLDPKRLHATLQGIDDPSPALKEALAKLGALIADINTANVRKEKLAGESRQISEDQDRIRRNIEATGRGSDLGRRYLDTLRVQEDRLNAINTEVAKLDADVAAKHEQAAQIGKTLTL